MIVTSAILYNTSPLALSLTVYYVHSFRRNSRVAALYLQLKRLRIYIYMFVNIYKNTKRDIGTLETLIMWQAKRITSFKIVGHVFPQLHGFLSMGLAVYVDVGFGSSFKHWTSVAVNISCIHRQVNIRFSLNIEINYALYIPISIVDRYRTLLQKIQDCIYLDTFKNNLHNILCKINFAIKFLVF